MNKISPKSLADHQKTSQRLTSAEYSTNVRRIQMEESPRSQWLNGLLITCKMLTRKQKRKSNLL